MARIVCQVLHRPDRVTFIWSEGQAFFEPSDLTGAALDEFRRLAREAGNRLQGASAGQTPSSLAQIGQQLHAAIFPAAAQEIRDWLADLQSRGQVESLEMVGDKPASVPWNLVCEPAPAGRDATCWGVRHNLAVGRRVSPWREFPYLEEPEILFVVDPALPADARDRLAELAREKSLRVVESRAELRSAIQAEAPDFLYVFCRAEDDHLLLGPDRVAPSRLADVLADEEIDPVVFLNLCSAGAPANTTRFLQPAFHALIANTATVPADVAGKFGIAVLQAVLFGGEAVGPALRKLRAQCGPATWSYTAFCPPELRVASEQAPAEPTGPEPEPLPEQPYRPLAPYDREERGLFCGREGDVTTFGDLLDDADTPLLLLHGEAEAGKASFLRAGVIPHVEDFGVGYRALRDRSPDEEGTPTAEEDHAVLAIRSSQDVAGQIAEALCVFCAQPYAYTTPTGKTVTVDLPALLRSHVQQGSTAIQEKSMQIQASPSSGEPQASAAPVALGADAPAVEATHLWRRMLDDAGFLGRLLAAVTERLPFELVIVVEQAEELYTQGRSALPERKRRDELALLAQAAAAPARCKWILSLRTDYVGHVLDDWSAVGPNAPREYLLRPLTEEQLVDAVTLPTSTEPIPYAADVPFEKYGFAFEEGVPRKLVTQTVQAARRSGQAVLPLLQTVCAQLVEGLADRPDKIIRDADLTGLGDLEAALAKYVDSRIKAIPAPLIEQRALRGLFATLYSRRGDGALTRNLVTTQAVVNAWQGRQPGETVQQVTSDAAPLLEVNRLLVAGKETDYVSLSQDSLARVAETWAEQRRSSQHARTRIIDMLWIFIPLLVLTAAVTMFIMRLAGPAVVSKTKYDNDLQDQLQRAQKIVDLFAYQSSVLQAQQAWQQGSAYLASDVLNAARKRLGEESTPFEWNYLRRLVDSHLREFGHRGQVGILAVSPDDKLVASAGNDGSIRVFAAASGKKLNELSGHEKAVTALAFAGDSKTLASAGEDKTVRLWNVEQGKQIQSFAGHTDVVHCVAITRDGQTVVSAGADKTAIIWSAKSAKELFKLPHTAPVLAMALDPDQKILATAGAADHAIYLWDLATGKRRSGTGELVGHTGPVNALAFAANGKTLVSGATDREAGANVGTARQWTVATGKESAPLVRHAVSVLAVAYSRDGKLLITGGKDEILRVWEASTGTLQTARPAQRDWIRGVAVFADGERIAACDSISVRLWTLSGLLGADVLRGHDDWVCAVAFSPDGKFVVSGGGDRDRSIRFWDPETRKQLDKAIGKLEGPIVSLALSGDQAPYALAAAVGHEKEGIIKLWHVKQGAKSVDATDARTLHEHSGAVTAVAFSPDGKLMASASRDKTALIWDAKTGKVKRKLNGHKRAVLCLAWSVDGKFLATGGADGAMRVWDVESGKRIDDFRSDPAPGAPAITALVFLTKGQVVTDEGTLAFTRLVSGSESQSLRLWAPKPAGRTFQEHAGAVTCAAWNANTGILVSGGWDGLIKSWSVDSGEERITFTGHTGPVRAVAISPDGNTIASASHDGTVRLWRGAPPKARPQAEEGQ